MTHLPEPSKEWEQVRELYAVIDDIDSPKAQDFIQNLHDFLDPYIPFEEAVEGDCDRQFRWLNSLYERYVNGDEEAAEEWWDE